MLNILGYFSLGVALMGLGSTLFGDAGFWGFLVFILGALFGGLWLLLALVFRKAGRVREVLFPSTGEAVLRRRLMLAALKAPVRSEANAALERLRRVEHVWPSIQRHLGERLDPAELTYQRYEDTARRARTRALQELEDATSLVEALAVMETGVRSAEQGGRDEPRQTRRERLHGVLGESERAIAALERLDFALVSDLKTGSASRGEDLDTLAEELDRLARRARLYVSGG